MRAKTVWTAWLCALCLLLGGCGTAPQTKTILLPEEETETADPAYTKGQDYTVHKIYSREIKDGLPWLPEIYLDGEHGFRYWSSGQQEDGLSAEEQALSGSEEQENGYSGENMACLETSVDYRYGFHEERELPLEPGDSGRLALLQKTVARGQTEGETGCDAVSPDGRYVVYIDDTQSDSWEQLYLLDTRTGDVMQLLDGRRMERPREEYRILAAWSPDSEVLCYGFCMRELTEEKVRFDGDVLHFRQLSSGEHTFIGAFSWKESMELGELADIQLYADWKDGRLRAALVYSFTSDQQNTSEDLFRVQFIFSNDLDGVNGSESVGWPPSTEILTDTAYGKLPVYLDAEQDRVYIAQERRIYEYDGAGDYQEQIELEPDTQIAGFLVLDDGNTVIAAERSSGKPDTDICLYQRSGDSFARRTLYMGCGYVYRMEYDADHNRLLIDASNALEERDLSFYTWQGIVLEF